MIAKSISLASMPGNSTWQAFSYDYEIDRACTSYSTERFRKYKDPYPNYPYGGIGGGWIGVKMIILTAKTGSHNG